MNELEETIRVIDVQIKEYNKKAEKAGENYEKFNVKCEPVLNKEYFDFISDLLYKLEKYYRFKVEESIAAKNELLKKYHIPIPEEDDNQ